MRTLLLSIAALGAAPVQAQVTEIAPGIELPAGVTVETRVGGDFNADGLEDHAYVARNEDSRALTVLLSLGNGPDRDFEYRAEVLILDLTESTRAKLALDGDTLVLEDTTGGSTAIASTQRFRYDGRSRRMRLIGLDVTLYSRTHAHDGFEVSWNLINGDTTTRELRLARRNGAQAYERGRQRSFKRRTRPQWLPDSPNPATVVEEMRED